MHFVDRAKIYVKAGDGGDGIASFRREKYVPKGGPNGGDGGDGGDVILKTDTNLTTLLDVVSQMEYYAGDGEKGSPHKRDGADGEDVVILVPVGTIVRDRDTGLSLKDMKREGMTAVVARGGKGGRGNVHFKSSTNQAPTRFEEGTRGRDRHLELELKLVADAGLVGEPNAGKSTLLSRISAAHPKIAGYPFTTLQPELGVVDGGTYQRFTVADMPGLISGAHEGRGLGDEFLRHIERTRVLIHVVDAAPLDESDPVEAYRVLREELQEYSPSLAAKPEIVVASKMDLQGAEEGLERLQAEVGKEVLPISSRTGRGLKELVGHTLDVLEQTEESPAEQYGQD